MIAQTIAKTLDALDDWMRRNQTRIDVAWILVFVLIAVAFALAGIAAVIHDYVYE